VRKAYEKHKSQLELDVRTREDTQKESGEKSHKLQARRLELKADSNLQNKGAIGEPKSSLPV
jgi:hypothetical protein